MSLKLFKILSLAAVACCFMSCSEEPSHNQSALSLNANDEKETVLVPGYEIEWYNESTSELKFRNISDNFTDYFGEVTFSLDGKPLFVATAIVADINSQVFPSAVIYRDSEGKYYLNDCYPMIEAVMTMPEVQKNREARAAGMESFRKQLKLEKRLK